MAGGWDQNGFNKALDKVLAVTHRTVQVAVNTSAYYVARKAQWFTRKTDPGKIDSQLGTVQTVSVRNKKGVMKDRKVLFLSGAGKEAPLAALLVNKARGKAGLPGLQGSDMTRAIKKLIGRRRASIGFLSAGWIGAIRKLAPYADRVGGEPPIDQTIKAGRGAKGTATPAPSNWNPQAQIVNFVTRKEAPEKLDAALHRFGEVGLRRAMLDEEVSMNKYLHRKMEEHASAFNASQL